LSHRRRGGAEAPPQQAIPVPAGNPNITLINNRTGLQVGRGVTVSIPWVVCKDNQTAIDSEGNLDIGRLDIE
jgi:hypothetical protein